MMCKDFFIVVFSISSCLISGEVLANPISNIKTRSTSNLASFSSVFLPSLSSPNFLDIAQRSSPSPSPNPTSTTPSSDLAVVREKCKKDFQGNQAEISFCEGKALVNSDRRDDARLPLKSARDTFLSNGKPDKARGVEAWAAQNGIPLN
jgi:hypothetical protein